MFITKKHLSRRTFLRGAGVTVALPFLESMVPAATSARQAGGPRTRLGAIYFPHGATMAKWTPETEGRNFEFSEILQPLEPYRDWINVISDLRHPMGYGSGSATANHNRSSAVYLTGAFAETGALPHLGISVDQAAAKVIGQDTPLPSIELSIEEGSLSCGEGLSCAYRNTISWQGPSSPLPMENNPQVVFERLFGDGSTDEQRRLRRQQALGLLDSVMGDLAGLKGELPASDKVRLDQYLEDVREIERRIERVGQQVSGDNIEVPEQPVGIPADFEEHIKLMFDLTVLAWQAEITRISTLLMAKELSNAVYANSGVRDAFHTLSHHSNLQENKDRFALLNNYHVGLFTYFLEKLQATPDGDGTLLDHSLVLYGSGMSDGNQHNHDPLPVVLAGQASGRLEGNRHLRNPAGTTMSNLLLAMLHKLDVNQESFGDSTEVMAI
jgi:Protein of unknown function (DUF1552)